MKTRFTQALLAGLGALAICGGAASAAGPPPPVSTNGHAVKLVASGLYTPTSFAFGDGATFEGDGGADSSSAPPNGGVFLLKGGSATKLTSSLIFVAGLAWHQGALYVSGGQLSGSGATWTIQKWSGFNGSTFSSQKTIWTAPKKLDGLNGIAFGPDGRLYVGVDVGLLSHNDHAPASTTPYLYDILSMNANGKAFKVYASGIRQPWQFAFAPGAKAPLVSDLGQDKPAAGKFPDFLLKVRKGDNYGFPMCTHLVAKKCKGYTKPYRSFAPHTDIMGLAIVGKKLYMTSFVGNKGNGEVLSMALEGGKTRVLVKGLVAPFVGLGEHAGRLYIGELTGNVYSIKP